MKKILSTVALLLALTVMASAVTLDDLSQSRFYTTTGADALVEFMNEYGLNEENFSMAYINTATGEMLSFNGSKLMLAASTYKLPLNMLYCDMIADGVLTEETVITAELKKTLSDGDTLPDGAELIESSSATTVDDDSAPVRYKISRSGVVGELMRKSLVDSDNDSSELLLRYAYEGQGYDHYLDRIKIYGDYDFSVHDREMLYDNYFPCDYMIGCLKYLYEHSADYELVINYLKQAQPGMYFKRYLSCDIAHKYGYLGDSFNDVGIIYTDTPFLLACYTDGVSGGESVVGRLAELMAEYTDYTAAHDEYVAQQVEQPQPEEDETEPEPELTEEEKLQQMIQEIEAIGTPQVTVIGEAEEPSPEQSAEVESQPPETQEPEPEPEPSAAPQPEETAETDLLSLLLPGAVIVVCVIVIAAVLGSGKKKKKRKKGRHSAKR